MKLLDYFRLTPTILASISCPVGYVTASSKTTNWPRGGPGRVSDPAPLAQEDSRVIKCENYSCSGFTSMRIAYFQHQV